VKVLDFGLAAFRTNAAGHGHELSGTLGYLAPELLLGDAPSEQSDLYSFGMLACEVLLGDRPFAEARSTKWITSVLNQEPDLDGAPISPGLRAVLGRLLARLPAERYASTVEAAAALAAATGVALPAESALIRESFLQTVNLIGREPELARLKGALARALGGSGSAWLVSGESGVGKSRLLDELRVAALVRGARVYRGQAVSAGAAAYQCFISVLRELALSLKLEPLEASVLKSILPDLAALLEQPISDAPPLEAQAAQARLQGTLESVLLRQQEPTVVILEDLHWAAAESVELLRRLSGRLAELPLLIVASFRDDEVPNLAKQLPSCHVLKVERLGETSVAALLAAMLGDPGRRPELISLLQRETEGNAFFLVESVRALAEEAGGLLRVGEATLPERLLGGGMQAVVRRRLERVPEWARALLRVAAIAGRQLELALLRHPSLAAESQGRELELWLRACAEAAVLEVSDDRWRFAHDKLREGVLAELAAAQKQQLHRQVGEALEQLSPAGTSPGAATTLAYHFEQAGAWERTLHYALAAGEESLRRGALAEGTALLERAVALQARTRPDPVLAARAHRLLAKGLLGIGRVADSLVRAEEGLRLLGYPMASGGWPAARALAEAAASQLRAQLHDPAPARPAGSPPRSEALSADERARLDEAYALFAVHGEGCIYYSADKRVLYCVLGCANIAARTGDPDQQTFSYSALAFFASTIPLHELSKRYLALAEAAQQAARLPGSPIEFLRMRSAIQLGQGQWAGARADCEQAVALYRQLGDDFGTMFGLQMCSWAALLPGDLETAARYTQELRALAERAHNPLYLACGHGMFGATLLRSGRLAQARQALDIAAPFARESGGVLIERTVMSALALCAARQGDFVLARQLADATLTAMRVNPSQIYAAVAPLHSLVETYLLLLDNTPKIARQALRQRLDWALALQVRLARHLIIAKPQLLLSRGRLAELDGRPQAAQRHMWAALALAERLGMSHEAALARAALAALP